MLRKVFFGLLTIFFLVSCSSTGKANSDDTIDLREAVKKSAADMMKKLPPNTKIAFFNNSENAYSTLTEFVIEEISVILVNQGKLTLVDRENMDTIDKEHAFQGSGRVSDDEIISIGKKYGATSVGTCSVTGQFDLRRLRVKVLDVETGKVHSSTSYSVKNLGDYASSQANASTQTSAIVPLTGSEWYPNTLSARATQYYRFRADAEKDVHYVIEWQDYDFDHRFANVKVGVKREGEPSYIVPISNDGNYRYNKHEIEAGDITLGVSYIIEVQGNKPNDHGNYLIRVFSVKENILKEKWEKILEPAMHERVLGYLRLSEHSKGYDIEKMTLIDSEEIQDLPFIYLTGTYRISMRGNILGISTKYVDVTVKGEIDALNNTTKVTEVFEKKTR